MKLNPKGGGRVRPHIRRSVTGRGKPMCAKALPQDDMVGTQ